MVRIGVSVRHDLAPAARRVDAYSPALVRAMQDGTRRGADVLENAQKEAIPKKTGRTAGTVSSVVRLTGSGAEAHVGTSDEVAGYLERGTKPHQIRAKAGKAMRFEAGGRPVFARSVMHPGTKAHEWLRRSGEASLGPVEFAFADEVGRIFR